VSVSLVLYIRLTFRLVCVAATTVDCTGCCWMFAVEYYVCLNGFLRIMSLVEASGLGVLRLDWSLACAVMDSKGSSYKHTNRGSLTSTCHRRVLLSRHSEAMEQTSACSSNLAGDPSPAIQCFWTRITLLIHKSEHRYHDPTYHLLRTDNHSSQHYFCKR
jgi:hypothetical protein